MVSNNFDPYQDRHFVGPDLGPNFCKGYQQTTKVAAGIQRVKYIYINRKSLILTVSVW